MKNLEDLAKTLSELTYAEAAQLGEILAEKYNIKPSVQQTVVVKEEVKEEIKEQTEFTVILLEDMGTTKLQSVKELNNILNLGLKPTKELIDAPKPSVLIEKTDKALAEKIKETMEALGGKIEIK